MKISTLLLGAALTLPAFGESLDMPDVKAYHSPSEIYEDILEFEVEEDFKINKNLKICIEDECELFFHFEEDNYNYSTIKLKKGSKNGRAMVSNIKSIIGAAKSGVGMGGTITIKNIKIKNADGSSWSIGEITISGGAGLGQKAPVPGYEDGKQVQHK